MAIEAIVKTVGSSIHRGGGWWDWWLSVCETTCSFHSFCTLFPHSPKYLSVGSFSILSSVGPVVSKSWWGYSASVLNTSLNLFLCQPSNILLTQSSQQSGCLRRLVFNEVDTGWIVNTLPFNFCGMLWLIQTIRVWTIKHPWLLKIFTLCGVRRD